MNRKIHPNLDQLIRDAGLSLLGNTAKEIRPEKWQGLRITSNMVEVFDSSFRAIIPYTLAELKLQCDPDLPWADDHFKERVGGEPTNPGNTFKQWPYYQEDTYRENDIFTHTYQERIWPKRANKDPIDFNLGGIRGVYGDLLDLIKHLAENPTTRQAFLPIWFPEDTGVLHKGRVPCTLGYLFSYREGFLHITYYIRSCDFTRHFKNDVYLTCRLLLHVLGELQKTESPVSWNKVQPGRLAIHVESLHVFQSDLYELKKRMNFKSI